MIQRSRAVSPATKAAFHNVSGAGKSHTKREFFGLSKEDEEAIFAFIERRIQEQLAKDW